MGLLYALARGDWTKGYRAVAIKTVSNIAAYAEWSTHVRRAVKGNLTALSAQLRSSNIVPYKKL